MVNTAQLDCTANSGIFPRLDYITMIFHNVSINFVLNFIHCSDLQEDLVKNEYDRNYGEKPWVSYPLLNTGIKVEVRRDFLEKYNGLSCFDRNADFVRLDISGSGLDYLRSKDIDVESFFRQSIPIMECGKPLYHFTRADIAFDLVNYAADFLSLFSKHLSGTNYGTVKVRGCDRPLNYSEKTGTSEHTIYIGSTASKRLLRIYDKRFEYTKKKKKVYDLETLFPVSNVDSWVRFELQCRDDYAQHFLLDFPDYLSVYMWVYDYFAPVTDDHSISDFWFSIWKPDHVPYIIQNLQFIHSVLTKEDVIEKVGNSVDVIALYFTDFDAFHELMLKSFERLMRDPSSYGSNKRLRFYRILSILSGSSDGNIDWSKIKNLHKIISGNSSSLCPFTGCL